MSSKSNKPKSPPTPSRGLGDAVSDAKKLYEAYSHGTFARAEIASTLGISAASGPFAQRLFTLKAFGLISQSGDQYKVTDTFKALNSGNAGEASFQEAALSAIRSSDTFRELLDDFPNKLPPVETVASRLETQKKFNADRAKSAAGVLQKSLSFAGVLDGSNNILPVRDTKQNRTGSEHDDRKQKQDLDEHNDDPVADTLSLEIPVGEGRKVLVRYPLDLSSAEAKKVGNVLNAVVA